MMRFSTRLSLLANCALLTLGLFQCVVWVGRAVDFAGFQLRLVLSSVFEFQHGFVGHPL